MVVVILVVSASVVLTAILLFIPKVLSEYYTSKGVDAEVLGWDPSTGNLSTRIRRETATLKTTVRINPPETTAYVKVAREDEFGAKTPMIVKLSGPEDESWESAFCVGDTVRLTSDRFDVSRTKIGGTLDAKFVQKTNDETCE